MQAISVTSLSWFHCLNSHLLADLSAHHAQDDKGFAGNCLMAGMTTMIYRIHRRTVAPIGSDAIVVGIVVNQVHVISTVVRSHDTMLDLDRAGPCIVMAALQSSGQRVYNS